MIKTIVTDFSKVLLFARDPQYHGGLNDLNNRLLLTNASYSFFDYFVLNEELLEYYKKQNSTVPVFVFTTDAIQNHPAIKSIIRDAVSGVLSAKELKLSKADVSSYLTIAKQVHCPPGELLYIDDKASNIESAARAGLNTVLYLSNRGTMVNVDALINKG